MACPAEIRSSSGSVKLLDMPPEHFQWKTPQGVILTLRKVRPDDVPLFLWASETFSKGTRYFRFGKMASLNFTAQDIEPLCHPDDEWNAHYIVTQEESGEERFVANARYSSEKDRQSCEFSIVVMDQWHHHGVGKRLVKVLCEHAAKKGIPLIYGLVLPTNLAMQKFMKKCGFLMVSNPDNDIVLRFERRLD